MDPGRALALRRKVQGLSQQGLARKVGVGVNMLSTWEKGAAVPGQWRPRFAAALGLAGQELEAILAGELPGWERSQV